MSEADSNAYFVVLKVVFYWIPFALQFTSYSLFSLFLGKVVYREEWKSDRCKRTFLTGFTTSNAVLFIFVMVWATWSTLIAIRSPLLPVTPATHSNASGGGGGGPSPNPNPSPSPFSSPGPATPAPHHVGSAEFHGGGSGIPWVPTHHANCEIQVLDAVLEAVMGASFAVLFLSFTLLTYKYITITTQQVSSRMLVFQPKHLSALCVSVGGVGHKADGTRAGVLTFFLLLFCVFLKPLQIIMSLVFLSRAAVNFYNFSNELTGARDDCNSRKNAPQIQLFVCSTTWTDVVGVVFFFSSPHGTLPPTQHPGETASNSKWNALNLGSAHDEEVWALVMALIWEIIPTMLILLTIATRQGHSSGAHRRRSNDRYGSDGNGSGYPPHTGEYPHGGRGNGLNGGQGRGHNGGRGEGLLSGGWSSHNDQFGGPGGEGLWSSSQHGGLQQNDEIESAKRWLEGGDLFQDDMRYDSLPSDRWVVVLFQQLFFRLWYTIDLCCCCCFFFAAISTVI